MTNDHILPVDDEPDLRGWDRDRDGWMQDYEGIEPGVRLEPYNPDKDPVLKGVVPSPYGGER